MGGFVGHYGAEQGVQNLDGAYRTIPLLLFVWLFIALYPQAQNPDSQPHTQVMPRAAVIRIIDMVK